MKIYKEHNIFLDLRSFGTKRIGKLHYVSNIEKTFGQVYDTGLQEGFLPLGLELSFSGSMSLDI